jgi:hypothetical protein
VLDGAREWGAAKDRDVVKDLLLPVPEETVYVQNADIKSRIAPGSRAIKRIALNAGLV